LSDIRPVNLSELFGRAPAETPPPPAEPALPDLLATERAIGRAEGEAAAQAMLAAELESAAASHAARLQMAMATAQAAQDELATVLANSLAQLLIAGWQALLATMPELPQATVRDLVAEVLAAAPAEGGGRLLVHPDMLAAARDGVPAGWQLDADITLAMGGVRAEVEASVYATSLARRLERLAAILTGDLE